MLENLSQETPDTNTRWCRCILNGIHEPAEPRCIPHSIPNGLAGTRPLDSQNIDRAQKPLRIASVGRCSLCPTRQCKNMCERICKCMACKMQCEQLAIMANNLCLRLHLRCGEILAQQGAPTFHSNPLL